ncbi:MAG: M81 family metallopeptidase [Candidatus Rokubacteria bacterium]|nr:M81 family metallopeptidase [Candidatus Rokubacteria bacterium]
MRIAIGQVMEESNTFVRQRADLEHFRNNQLLTADEIVAKLRSTRAEIGGFLEVLEPAGVEVVPTLAANCVSSGPVPRGTFEALRDDLLRRLAAAGPLDGVLLALHGAMVLEDDPDGEGALLAAVRTRVGERIPIVATLDLHGDITPRMVAEADALVGYDTYPHIDLYETGVKGARLLLAAARGEVRPVTLFAKSPMIVPAEGMGTSDQPMAGLLADAERLEQRPGVLSVSLFPVQPWLDIPGTGFSVVVVADGARRAAEIEPVVRELAWKAWQSRRAFEANLLEVDEAIRRALAIDGGPIILSESADGTGAGSPGDSVAVLARLLALGVRARCLATVVDAPAVGRAIEAGVGHEVTVPVGGTLDSRYSAPITITGRVRILSDGRFTASDRKSLGTEGHMGRAAVIEVGAISVLATERPAFTVDPAFYRSVGLEPRDAKIVAVKSALQFRDGYGPFARAMWVVDTPGPSTANFQRLTWTRIARPLFPFDDDFEPEIRSVVGRARR